MPPSPPYVDARLFEGEAKAAVRGQRLRAALALLAGWGLCFGWRFGVDAYPFFRDQLLTALPCRAYLHERLWALELPQWYPWEGLGVPFIGQVVTGTFHPQTLLFLPLSALSAVRANTLLAYLAGAWGGYLATRRLGGSRVGALTGAAAFALGGYSLGVSNNLTSLVSHLTLPWVFWASLRVCERRRLKDVALLALLWASVFLTGDAQQFGVVAPLVLLASWGVRGFGGRPLAALAVAGGLAVALCAAELLPALAVSAGSIRAQGVPLASLFQTRSLHPLRLLELGIPGFLPDSIPALLPALFQEGAVWSTTVFAGAGVLVLAVSAGVAAPRSSWPYGALALLGLSLALGARVGVLPSLAKLLPVLARFRFPEKYLSLFWFGLLPLVCRGADEALRRPHRVIRAALGFALVLGGAGALLALELWQPLGSAEAQWGPARAAWSTGLFTSGAFALALALALVWSRHRPAAGALLPALVFAELALGNGGMLKFVPREALEGPNVYAQQVRASARGAMPAARVLPLFNFQVAHPETFSGERWVKVMRNTLKPSASGLEHLASVGFNLPANSERAQRAFGPSARDSGVLGPRLNACFRVSDARTSLREGERWASMEQDLGFGLVAQPCSPRAFLAGTVPAADERSAAALLAAGIPSTSVVWERPGALPRAEGEVVWKQFAPESLLLDVRAQAPAALFLSDEWAPGWTATVDGESVPIYSADLVGRAIEVPAGAHQVAFRYRTPGLTAGLWISGLGLLTCVGLLVARPRRRSERATAPAAAS